MPQLYLHILRAAVLDTPLPHRLNITDDVLHDVMRISYLHGTDALIANQLLKMGVSSMALKQVCMQSMLNYQRLRADLCGVWDALSHGGIQPVLLKGFGLAQLYPAPYLRQWGDADIWVGQGRYDEVVPIITSVLDVVWHHEDEHINARHYNFNTADGMVFEIHPNTIPFILPREIAAYHTLEMAAMAQAETISVDGHAFRIPEAQFNLLFVFLHAWEHFSSTGVGMKQLADLALLVTRRSYDEPYLRRALVSVGHLQPWRVMGYVIVKAFGLQPQQWPLYDHSRRTARLGERLYSRILSEGLCRPKAPSHTVHNKWLGKAITLWNRICTSAFLWPYSPRYAMHSLHIAVYKGCARLSPKAANGI